MLLRARITRNGLAALLVVAGSVITAHNIIRALTEDRYDTVKTQAETALWHTAMNVRVAAMRSYGDTLLGAPEVASALAEGDMTGVRMYLDSRLTGLDTHGAWDGLVIYGSGGEQLTALAGNGSIPAHLDPAQTEDLLTATRRRGGTINGLVSVPGLPPQLVHARRVNLASGEGIGVFHQSVDKVLNEFAAQQNVTATVITADGSIFSTNQSIYRTLGLSQEILKNAASDAIAEEITVNDRIFEVSILPIQNALGNRFGQLVVAQDQTGFLGALFFWDKGSLIVVGLAVVLGAVALYLTSRRALSPLNEAVIALEALARGDTSVSPSAPHRDEVGQMVEAIEIFKARRLANEAREQAAAEREETLRREAEEEKQRRREEQNRIERERMERETTEREALRRKLLEDLSQDFRAKVSPLIAGMETAAQDMVHATAALCEQADSANTLSVSAAEETAAANQSLSSVVQSTGALSSSISDIGSNTGLSRVKADEAVGDSQAASDQVERLSEMVGTIGDITTAITEIAEQTNLLALNATIEAARAGEAGKGFAVVANEVKSLASQTAKATQEIEGRIQAIQEGTEGVTEGMSRVRQAIAGVTTSIEEISSAIDNQTRETDTIASMVEQAGQRSDKAVHNLDTLKGAATDTRASAVHMHETSSAVATRADELKREVDAFLSQLAQS